MPAKVISSPPSCPRQYRAICRKSRSLVARMERSAMRVAPPECAAAPLRRLIRATSLRLDAAHAAHDPPLVRGHRLDREPRLLGQHHVREPPVGFDGRERHRLWERPPRLHVDPAKKTPVL